MRDQHIFGLLGILSIDRKPVQFAILLRQGCLSRQGILIFRVDASTAP